MPIRRCLFIGGCADGERIVVDDDMPYQRVRSHERLPFSVFDVSSEIPASVSYREEEYKRHTLCWGTTRWIVYAHERIQDGEIIPYLIGGYQRSDSHFSYNKEGVK